MLIVPVSSKALISLFMGVNRLFKGWKASMLIVPASGDRDRENDRERRRGRRREKKETNEKKRHSCVLHNVCYMRVYCTTY